MYDNFIRILFYMFSWIFWAFRHLIFIPAGMLALIFGLLLMSEYPSPGRILVNIIQDAGTVTHGVNWTWRECPAIDGTKVTPPLKAPSAPSVAASECPIVVSDADGYAAHIDSDIIPLVGFPWSIIAFISVLIAFGSGNYPCLRLSAVRLPKGLIR